MNTITLNIGDVIIVDDPSIMKTVLGSCVSVCLWDEKLRTGGMNHFMSPRRTDNEQAPGRCAYHSMEKLLDGMMRLGSSPANIKAKIFGGGNVVEALADGFHIGAENVRIAREILAVYEIPIIRESTFNDCGIKVIFYSHTGKAFVKRLENSDWGGVEIDLRCRDATQTGNAHKSAAVQQTFRRDNR